MSTFHTIAFTNTSGLHDACLFSRTSGYTPQQQDSFGLHARNNGNPGGCMGGAWSP
jgi:hypothetical protein